MAPNFSKNAILKGPADFFCLVCETYFTTINEGEEHISRPDHKKKIDSIKYVEEYKNDSIKKIKNGYFCEICNKILPVFARVRLHLFEPSHIEKKNTGILKRIGRNVVAFDKISMDNATWHGLFENSCTICNIEYENEEVHINLPHHILNLIQMKVQFDKDENIYRKIDESSFQCLTCNQVQSLSNLTNHFETTSHIEMYQKCCDACTEIKAEMAKQAIASPDVCVKEDKKSNGTNTDVNKENNSAGNETKAEMSELKEEVSKNETTPGDVKGNVEVDKNTNENNNETKIPFVFVFDEQWEGRICKMLKGKDYITMAESRKPWCFLCNWAVDFRRIQEHIDGKHHQILLRLHNGRKDKLRQGIFPRPIRGGGKKDGCGTENSTAIPLDADCSGPNAKEININFELKTAFCKKCSINLEFDEDETEESHFPENDQTPPKNENKTIEVKACQFSIPICVKAAAMQGETSKETKDAANEINATNSTQNSKEEVEEENASNTKINKVNDCPFQKVPSDEFFESLISASSGMYNDIIINQKFCISFFSLCFMTFLLDRSNLKCYACDESILFETFRTHATSPKHETIYSNSLVISQFDTELIREIRPGCYHCGFCNSTEPSWEDMETHMKSTLHNECKTNASWRFQRYQAEVSKNMCEKLMVDKLVSQWLTRKFT